MIYKNLNIKLTDEEYEIIDELKKHLITHKICTPTMTNVIKYSLRMTYEQAQKV